MIIFSAIVWVLISVYVWYFDLYDNAYFLISALVFFVPCVDFISFADKIFGGEVKRMWAMSGLGLISGLAISAGVALTSIRFYEGGSYIGFSNVIYIPWILGFLGLVYFLLNFFLYSRKLRRRK